MITPEKMSPYERQAEEFLEKHGIMFRVEFVGSDCPQFCEDKAKNKDMDKLNVFPRKTHIHGKQYRCFLTKHNKESVSFDFCNSYRDEEENFFNFGRPDNPDAQYWDKYRIGGKYPNGPKNLRRKKNVPTAYDLLACLTKSNPGTFAEFCAEYGYDEDSPKAESTYHAVVKEWHKVQTFFSSEELNLLQEVQ